MLRIRSLIYLTGQAKNNSAVVAKRLLWRSRLTEIQNPKHFYDLQASKTKSVYAAPSAGACVRGLDIGICDLFVIWCLEFVILGTKLHGRAKRL